MFYGTIYVRFRRHTDEVIYLADLVCENLREGGPEIVLDYGDTVAVLVTVRKKNLTNPIRFSFVEKRVRQYDLPVSIRQKMLKRVMANKPTRTR